jgi:hypothetical protein
MLFKGSQYACIKVLAQFSNTSRKTEGRKSVLH